MAEYKNYKIGDTGPAGGLVFYDWWESRTGTVYGVGTQFCLEAAPYEKEFTSAWGPKDISVEEAADGFLGEETGSGSRAGEGNTKYIIQTLGKRDSAAKKCADLVVKGWITGWFLPSLYQLDLMYNNLHIKGLGNFKGIYWSSTEREFNRTDLARHACLYSFITGVHGYAYKINIFNVRAVRQFEVRPK